MAERLTRTDYLLAENLRTLIAARRVDAKDLAMACGHEPSWISKILNGDRGMRVEDVGKAAAFFGLTASELLAPWISPLLERRRAARRSVGERRRSDDRRKRTLPDNSVAQSYASGVELPRPALKGGTDPYAPRDPDSAALDLSTPAALADIDARLDEHVAAIGRLYELRERTLASPPGNGAPRTTQDKPAHRTAPQDVTRRRVAKHHG